MYMQAAVLLYIMICIQYKTQSVCVQQFELLDSYENLHNIHLPHYSCCGGIGNILDFGSSGQVLWMIDLLSKQGDLLYL